MALQPMFIRAWKLLSAYDLWRCWLKNRTENSEF